MLPGFKRRSTPNIILIPIMVVADVGRYDDDDGDSLSTKNADDNSQYDVHQLYQNAVECIVNSKSVISKLQARLSTKDAQILTKDAQIMQLEEELIRTKLDLATTKAMHDHDRFMLQTTARMDRGEDNEEPCRPPSMITAYTPSTILAPTSNRRNSTGGVRDDINRNSDKSSGSKSGFMSWPEPNDDDIKTSTSDNVHNAPKTCFTRRSTVAGISVRVGVPLSSQLSSSSSIWDRIKKSKTTSTFQHDDHEASAAKRLSLVNCRATSFHQDDRKTSTAKQSSLGNGRSTSNSSWGLLRSSMSAYDYQQDDYEEANDAKQLNSYTRSSSDSRWDLLRKSMNNLTFPQDDYEDNNTARLTSWGTRSTSNSSFGSMINSGRSQSDSLSHFGGKNIPSGRSTDVSLPTKYPRRITDPTAPCILEGSGVVVFPESHDDCDQHLWRNKKLEK